MKKLMNQNKNQLMNKNSVNNNVDQDIGEVDSLGLGQLSDSEDDFGVLFERQDGYDFHPELEDSIVGQEESLNKDMQKKRIDVHVRC